jgi:hypothetical protein
VTAPYSGGSVNVSYNGARRGRGCPRHELRSAVNHCTACAYTDAWRCDRFHDIRTGATLFTTSIENAFLEDTEFTVIFGGNNFLPALSDVHIHNMTTDHVVTLKRNRPHDQHAGADCVCPFKAPRS